MIAAAAIDRETVVEVMSDVWSSFLHDTSIFEAAQPSADDETSPDRIVASVCVDGPWCGAFLVTMRAPAGRQVAAVLLGIDSADVSNPDMYDAMGEVANVVGGNLKTLLPPPSALSLPVVATAAEPRVVPAGAVEILRVHLDWAGTPVEVGIWQSGG